MDSHDSYNPERAAIVLAAEEILLHVRQVARRMQERILKTLGERTPPPSDTDEDQHSCPDARGAGRGSGCP